MAERLNIKLLKDEMHTMDMLNAQWVSMNKTVVNSNQSDLKNFSKQAN